MFSSKQMMTLLLIVNIFHYFVFTGDLKYKVKSFKCTASNRTISNDFECFAKTYNRVFSSLNFKINITRPISTAMASI